MQEKPPRGNLITWIVCPLGSHTVQGVSTLNIYRFAFSTSAYALECSFIFMDQRQRDVWRRSGDPGWAFVWESCRWLRFNGAKNNREVKGSSHYIERKKRKKKRKEWLGVCWLMAHESIFSPTAIFVNPRGQLLPNLCHNLCPCLPRDTVDPTVLSTAVFCN